MAETNELIKALGQVPELIEKTDRVLEDSDKKFRILAEATQKRIQAEISPSEVEKVANAAAEAVSRTKCVSPDLKEVSHLVAENITNMLIESVKPVMVDAITGAIKGTPVRVEHHHTHTTLRYLCQMTEQPIRSWITGLATISIILSFYTCASLYSYFNGEKYLGSQYNKIYFSEYTTDEERKMLDVNTYTVGFIPYEFETTPKLVKQKIKRNLQILRQREMEAKANNGKFSTRVPLER